VSGGCNCRLSPPCRGKLITLPQIHYLDFKGHFAGREREEKEKERRGKKGKGKNIPKGMCKTSLPPKQMPGFELEHI